MKKNVVLAVMLIVSAANAQPNTQPTTEPASPPAELLRDKTFASYRDAMDRELATYRGTATDLRSRRDDAIIKAESTMQKAQETADAAYRSGTTRARELLEQARKSRNAAAIQSYDREINTLASAGDLEKSAALSKIKENFIAWALQESAKQQAEASAVEALAVRLRTPDPHTPMVTLRVKAAIDGSDELLIRRDSATWHHKTWGGPTNVEINGIKWNPTATPILENTGRTAFLPSVDFSKAIVKARSGRDTVACETSPDGIKIFFADADNGGDTYEITVEIPIRSPAN